MAESYSVKARLSATDNGFSSTLKGALGSVNSLADRIKGGFTFGVLSGIGQQAFSAITGSVQNLMGEAVSASDSMQKLQQAMRFSGESESEIERIAGATGTLKTYADRTVFSLEDVMSTFGALSANGIKDADKMTESVGNAVAVFGGGAKEYSSVGLAFSQAMAAGALHAQDWNQILNASPQLAGGLKKELVKLNPVLANDFKGAMEDGEISAELLGKAMNNIGMKEAAKEAATSVTTFEGAIGNLEATVQSGLMSIFDSFGKSGLINVINAFNAKVGAAFNWLSTAIPSAINKINPYWEALKSAFSGVGSALGEAFGAVKSSLSELMGEFGSTQSADGFKTFMQGIAEAIKGVAGFVKQNAGTIAQLIKWLPAIVLGFKGFGILKTVAPGLLSFGKGLAGLAGKGISGIASKLFGISKAQTTVGETSLQAGTQMLTSAKSFALMGLAVLVIAGGFALLAFSAIALANSGGGAIAVMAGITVALIGLMIGMTLMLKSLAACSAGMIPAAGAMLMLGGAVVLIAAGFWIMAQASIALAAAGGGAIAMMIVLVAVMAGLAIGAAVLGTALTAGAVGFIAFGVAIALVGVGALLAAVALQMVVAVLPALVQYGLQGALSILALGGALLVFGAGALVAGVGALVLGAGLLVCAAAVLLLVAGVMILGLGMMMIGQGAMLAAVGLSMLTTILPKLTENALGNAAGLAILAGGLAVFGAAALVAGTGALLLGTSLIIVGAGLMVCGLGAIVAAAAINLLSFAIPVLAESGVQGAVGLAVLSVALAVFGGAALIAGVGALTLGAGLLVCAAAVLVLCAGVLVLSAAILVVSVSALVAAAALALLSLVMPIIAQYGTQAAAATAAFGAALLVFAAGAATAGLGAAAAAVGIVAFGVAMLAAVVGTLAMAAALLAVNSSMSKIAKNAVKAENSLNSMKDSVNVVEEGLKALGDMAGDAMNALCNAFKKTADKAETSGVDVGKGFTSGMQKSLAGAPMVAVMNVGLVVAMLKAGRNSAYSAGAYFSQGFAQGMLSQLSAIQRAATLMSAAADKAVRAKLKIHSPSQVSEDSAEYYGIGFVKKFKEMRRKVWAAAQNLVAIPQVATPDLSLTYGGEMSEDYEYYRNAEYTIVVPVEIDGKEVARTTAPYTEAELNKRQSRDSRKHGNV